MTIKLMTLNTWGGRAGKQKLLDFFNQHQDIDVFCLQEIWSAPYEHLNGVSAGGLAIDHSRIMTEGLQEISGLLSHHVAYFHPHHMDNYGLLTLVKNDLAVKEVGERFVHKEKGYVPVGDVGRHARNIQYITVLTASGPLTVINFHGLWADGHKHDNDDRLEQSRKILEFTQALGHPFILCGDFNLLPETESLKMLERAGLQNLIKEYGITSTRTALFSKAEKFADYVFASSGVMVKNFTVLSDEVSDHSPLVLEFELQ